jgi:hypothetical protein
MKTENGAGIAILRAVSMEVSRMSEEKTACITEVRSAARNIKIIISSL